MTNYLESLMSRRTYMVMKIRLGHDIRRSIYGRSAMA